MINSFNVTSATAFLSGQVFQFRAYAKNGVGYGAYSPILTVTGDYVPLSMTKPQVDLASNHVNPRWILVTWTSIAGTSQTGGDEPVYYEL